MGCVACKGEVGPVMTMGGCPTADEGEGRGAGSGRRSKGCLLRVAGIGAPCWPGAARMVPIQGISSWIASTGVRPGFRLAIALLEVVEDGEERDLLGWGEGVADSAGTGLPLC